MWQSHQCTRWTRRSLPKVSKLISQGQVQVCKGKKNTFFMSCAAYVIASCGLTLNKKSSQKSGCCVMANEWVQEVRKTVPNMPASQAPLQRGAQNVPDLYCSCMKKSHSKSHQLRTCIILPGFWTTGVWEELSGSCLESYRICHQVQVVSGDRSHLKICLRVEDPYLMWIWEQDPSSLSGSPPELALASRVRGLKKRHKQKPTTLFWAVAFTATSHQFHPSPLFMWNKTDSDRGGGLHKGSDQEAGSLGSPLSV